MSSLMTLVSGGGGGLTLKNIQTGTIQMNNGFNNAIKNIVPVDLSKAFILNNGVEGNSTSSAGAVVVRLHLKNTSQIEANRGRTEDPVIIGYTVVEFE